METSLNNIIASKNNPVGNPLLSERDGNLNLWNPLGTEFADCRKPTTLWKRWKPFASIPFFLSNATMSETHYSLKEMETFPKFTLHYPIHHHVGNPLLSERDGNSCLPLLLCFQWESVGNPLLSERDGNF